MKSNLNLLIDKISTSDLIVVSLNRQYFPVFTFEQEQLEVRKS